VRNKYWLLVTAVVFVFARGLGFTEANLFYCRYFLHDVNRFGPLMTVFQIALVVGMTVCGPLIKRLGKRNAALLGIVDPIFKQALIILSPSNYAVVGRQNMDPHSNQADTI